MINRTLQAVVIFGSVAVFLYLINSGIYGAEQRIANGTPVYLELAPVDPRSLIQGDYMVLDYQIERDVTTAYPDGTVFQRRGLLVATVDNDGVAHYARLYDGGALAADEILVSYRYREGTGLHVGVDSFLFQEGLGDEYAAARYAEVRVTPDGTVMLIELVGAERETLVE